jgi:hypothetical protein
MFTATGFIVMCVAAVSTCTANAVESPRPLRPDAELIHGARELLGFAPSGSSPRGEAAAYLRPCEMDAEIGGAADADADNRGRTGLAARFQHAVDHSASPRPTLRREPPSEPGLFSASDPFGAISIASVRRVGDHITGTPRPQVCSFRRVTGCTTEGQGMLAQVARSQPRRIASFSATPSFRCRDDDDEANPECGVLAEPVIGRLRDGDVLHHHTEDALRARRSRRRRARQPPSRPAAAASAPGSQSVLAASSIADGSTRSIGSPSAFA